MASSPAGSAPSNLISAASRREGTPASVERWVGSEPDSVKAFDRPSRREPHRIHRSTLK